MKTKNILFPFLSLLICFVVEAQDRTTVTARNSEISDNLDLRAIASIFGEAKDLEDFERQLNNPKNQISNLDLNEDNQVDYLRVVESVEGNAHLIIVQAVLGKDNYQDVATIELEKDQNNQVQIQVVGDVYMYGQNYIYEPVYMVNPIIYNTFWVPSYRPYCSVWYWNFYPTFYYTWAPLPVFRYRNHIHLHINHHHQYHYVKVRRCQRAMALYTSRRSNYLERTAPDRSFSSRNREVNNRFELDQVRNVRDVSTRRDDSAGKIKETETNRREIPTAVDGRNSTKRNETTKNRGSEESGSTTTNRNAIERPKSTRNENLNFGNTSRTPNTRESRQSQTSRSSHDSRAKNEYTGRQRSNSSSRRGQ